MFSQSFLEGLIQLALAWTFVGVLTLLGLVIRDWVKGTLW